MSKTGDSELDSDQESAMNGGPQASPAQYIQPCPKAIETGQIRKKHCPDWTKPYTSLPSLAATRMLHMPIDDAQAGWLNCFLMNKDIPSNDIP